MLKMNYLFGFNFISGIIFLFSFYTAFKETTISDPTVILTLSSFVLYLLVSQILFHKYYRKSRKLLRKQTIKKYY